MREEATEGLASRKGLLQGRGKLILLDDNLPAHADGPELLEEMARRRLQVNFNQTLDLQRLTPEAAGLLRRISRQCGVYPPHLPLQPERRAWPRLVRRRYALPQTRPSDNVEFICMYGFNTTLAQDVERIRFLRSLPAAYVFGQRYQPIPGQSTGRSLRLLRRPGRRPNQRVGGDHPSPEHEEHGDVLPLAGPALRHAV